MANIVRKPEMPTAPTRSEWDPFRMMREMMRWEPFAEMAPLFGHERGMFQPSFEVKETPSEYLFKADLPGVKEEDLDVAVTGNRLTVSGKREAEEKQECETYYAYERSYGSFTRSFTMPEGVDADHVQAELKSGVLTLVLPKRPEMQPKKINLKGLSPKGQGKA
jgi:HSP20 family protein